MDMFMEYADENPEEVALVNPTEGYVVTALLSFLGVAGTAGNALVLYVFSRRTDRLVSTLFILSLAVVDFTTCLIVVPFTVYMEHTTFRVDEDFVCKLYHFLITCNVPFSAMVMVAIAIDRYFCICHPWMNAITSRSARRIIAGLGLLSICIGICVSCMHGIYHPWYLCQDLVYNVSSAPMTFSPSAVPPCGASGPHHPELRPAAPDPCPPMTVGCTTALSESPLTAYSVVTTSTPLESLILRYVKTSECAPTSLLLSDGFQFYYHKFHNSIYAVCFFAVVFLYVAIYRSVLKRRRKRQRESRRTVPTDTCVVLTRSVVAGDTQPSSAIEPKIRLSLRPIENSPSDVGESPRRRFQALSRLPSYDGNLVANMRTAVMLFVVTVVFMITFLPAWLMIMNWVTFSRSVFYLYFANNAANPVIYSFMNRNFRESLKRLLWRNRSSERPRAARNGLKRNRALARARV